MDSILKAQRAYKPLSAFDKEKLLFEVEKLTSLAFDASKTGNYDQIEKAREAVGQLEVFASELRVGLRAREKRETLASSAERIAQYFYNIIMNYYTCIHFGQAGKALELLNSMQNCLAEMLKDALEMQIRTDMANEFNAKANG